MLLIILLTLRHNTITYITHISRLKSFLSSGQGAFLYQKHRKGTELIMEANYIPFEHDGMVISFSGIDGSGKTTLLNRLAEYFDKHGLHTLKTKQPTSNYRQHPSVRKLLSTGVTDVSFEAIALLSAFDRLCHISELRREIKQRDVILTDRYLLDGIVSFVARGIDSKWVQSINSFCPQPHIGILVDCPGSVAQARILERGSAMTYDEKFPEILELKRQLFLKYCTDSTFVVDGTKDSQAVFKEVLNHINSQLSVSAFL